MRRLNRALGLNISQLDIILMLVEPQSRPTTDHIHICYLVSLNINRLFLY